MTKEGAQRNSLRKEREEGLRKGLIKGGGAVPAEDPGVFHRAIVQTLDNSLAQLRLSDPWVNVTAYRSTCGQTRGVTR